MRTLANVALVLAVIALATPALADDEAPAVGCVKVIPARTECVEREIVIPARMATRCVPVFEDIEIPVYNTRQVPVYRTRRTPIYEDVEVPCWNTRRVPVYATRRIPVFKDVEVPVFRAERVPVTREVCDPCTGAMVPVCVYDVRVVQCGTRLEKRICGWEEERVECGWRVERYRDGTRTVKKLVDFKCEEVVCGTRCETYQDGTRTERRQTGTRAETYEVCPARTIVRTERITIPCRRVTVVPDGTEGAAPLPGTTEVMTDTEFVAGAAL